MRNILFAAALSGVVTCDVRSDEDPFVVNRPRYDELIDVRIDLAAMFDFTAVFTVHEAPLASFDIADAEGSND